MRQRRADDQPFQIWEQRAPNSPAPLVQPAFPPLWQGAVCVRRRSNLAADWERRLGATGRSEAGRTAPAAPWHRRETTWSLQWPNLELLADVSVAATAPMRWLVVAEAPWMLAPGTKTPVLASSLRGALRFAASAW